MIADKWDKRGSLEVHVVVMMVRDVIIMSTGLTTLNRLPEAEIARGSKLHGTPLYAGFGGG